MAAKHFFNESEQQRIIGAIQQAERQTSGEIKLHIEPTCPASSPLERAEQLLGELGLRNTILRNGVIFYLAYEDHLFAILGDEGIYTKVPTDFWDSTKDLLRTHFVKGEFVEGFCKGIEEAGAQLKRYFPSQADGANEIPDELSFG
jgi:uncharacterized membrane protein